MPEAFLMGHLCQVAQWGFQVVTVVIDWRCRRADYREDGGAFRGLLSVHGDENRGTDSYYSEDGKQPASVWMRGEKVADVSTFWMPKMVRLYRVFRDHVIRRT